ncbi:MAG TPA: DUF3048 domain-containing protein [Anaerolineales bacterium]|nr:DUF3048 domain-containing protein [Anaerolineales bacterium]
MKKILNMLVFVSIALSACGTTPTAAPTPTAAESPATAVADTPTPLPVDTPTVTPTMVATLNYPANGYGPTGFPAGVDPLTGLEVADPALLQRRPMLIQVSNAPRNVRPQWGLSLADIVFEYYTETGMTRFSAIYYGNDASTVGPIRSGRFIDSYLVDGYKAVFAFGSAYAAEMSRFLRSDFANRMVIEAPYTPLKRYDPNGLDYLVVNTADLSAYATIRGINQVQNLNDMLFLLPPPSGGQPGTEIYIHYSSSTYNRWDYDPSSGKYLRFSDTADVTSVDQAEQYAQLTDRLTNQPLAFDNVVILYVNNKQFSRDIYDILLTGSGDAYAFRDGQAYKVKWQRGNTDIVSLTNLDGTPFPFKPGTTWFEVIGLNSTFAQDGQGWHFIHQMP